MKVTQIGNQGVPGSSPGQGAESSQNQMDYEPKSEKVKRWRKNTKSRIIEAMGGKCQCCGYDRCDSALALHHIDPSEKEFSLGQIRGSPIAWPRIVVELKKCVLLCHNCHSEIHAGVRQLPEIYSSFNEDYEFYRENPETLTPCPHCGKMKPERNRYCSLSCSSSSRRKVDWDSIDLIDLMKRYSISELERMLNVSNAAIYKRRKKILSSLTKIT